MGVQVLTDSTSYIDDCVMKELNIKIVSLNVIFKDDCYKETYFDNENFYKMMEEKGIPKSSQPSTGELYNEMIKVVKNGDSLICIFISSDMSGTYSTANLAKSMVLEEYSNASIEIIDSRSNCMQLGFAVLSAARVAKDGGTLQEAKVAALKIIKRSRFVFVPDNLEYLIKGGRIGGASALIGNIFKIIPVLTVENGITTVLMKVRTKKKAIIAITEKVLKDISQYGLGEIAIHHINCYNEALELQNIIQEKLNTTINIYQIGPVIGLHVGPGALGIVYYTENDIR